MGRGCVAGDETGRVGLGQAVGARNVLSSLQPAGDFCLVKLTCDSMPLMNGTNYYEIGFKLIGACNLQLLGRLVFLRARL